MRTFYIKSYHCYSAYICFFKRAVVTMQSKWFSSPFSSPPHLDSCIVKNVTTNVVVQNASWLNTLKKTVDFLELQNITLLSTFLWYMASFTLMPLQIRQKYNKDESELIYWKQKGTLYPNIFFTYKIKLTGCNHFSSSAKGTGKPTLSISTFPDASVANNCE